MPTYDLGFDVRKVRTPYCLMDPAGLTALRRQGRPRRAQW